MRVAKSSALISALLVASGDAASSSPSLSCSFASKRWSSFVHPDCGFPTLGFRKLRTCLQRSGSVLSLAKDISPSRHCTVEKRVGWMYF